MGKGDKRTKRGKLFRNSNGNSRPKGKTIQKRKMAARKKKAK